MMSKVKTRNPAFSNLLCQAGAWPSVASYFHSGHRTMSFKTHKSIAVHCIEHPSLAQQDRTHPDGVASESFAGPACMYTASGPWVGKTLVCAQSLSVCKQAIPAMVQCSPPQNGSRAERMMPRIFLDGPCLRPNTQHNTAVIQGTGILEPWAPYQQQTQHHSCCFWSHPEKERVCKLGSDPI